MRIARLEVLDCPCHFVTRVRGCAPTLVRRAGATDRAHLVPGTMGMEFDRAVVAHIGGFL
jgi:hypothetical protein